MKPQHYFFILFMLCYGITVTHAQPYYNESASFLKENSRWILDMDGPVPTGLNFNTTPLSITSPPTNLGMSGEGMASVADPVTGSLLFYSDGERCRNAAYAIMQNGDSLLGNSSFGPSFGVSTTQGACIVPFVNKPGWYYLFSLCGPTCWAGIVPNTCLYYSVIDMSLDGGLGGIVPGQKNIPLASGIPLSESMIAVPGNNCDVWLVVHDFSHATFRSFHITKDGVDPTPVTSNTGALVQGLDAYSFGCMAVSPNREVLGIASMRGWAVIPGHTTGVLLNKFDANTGQVSDPVEVGNVISTYSLAFSPDNTKLYVQNLAGPLLTASDLEQYSIDSYDSTTIAMSKVIINQSSGIWLSRFRLYDGKIYTVSLTDELCVINQPNLPGLSCGFQNTGLFVASADLPSEVVHAYPPDTASIKEDTVVCTRNGIMNPVSLSAPAGYDAYVWDDGSTGPDRVVAGAGTYRVLCKDSCHSLIDSIRVQPGQDLSFSLGTDTTLCNRQGFTLHVAVPGADYLWQDGSTHSSFTVTRADTVWLQATLPGCVVSDTVLVKIPDIEQDLGADIILCKDDPLQVFTLKANVPDGASVAWSTGLSTANITVTDTGKYWVSVVDAPCVGTDTIQVMEQICSCRVGMPNVFSPNGDGTNDVLRPVIEEGCAVRQYAFNVYNRYGARVYSGSSTAKGWDGRYPGGGMADAGTYMYELSFLGGTREVKYYRKGDVVLLR